MNYLYDVSRRDPAASFGWPVSARERARLERELLDLIGPALGAAAMLAGADAPDAPALLDGFLAAYGRRPLADNKGGSGLNDSLWLFCLARMVAPARIVESGTWRGQSAWLFRQACPAAQIVSFDLEVPAEGRCEAPDVTYCLRDWSSEPLAPLSHGQTLAFFDDHVSHARRLAEAAARGIGLALFDDNFAARHLHATGAPPVPTLAMLLDEATPPGGSVEWQRNGKIYRYDDSAERRMQARRLVSEHLTLPDLAPVTRHPPGSGLTLVRINTTT